MLTRSFIIVSASLLALAAQAAEAPAQAVIGVRERVRQELSKKYPSARVELAGELRWSRGKEPSVVDSISFLAETPRGEALVAVRGGEEYGEAWISYSAMASARTASKRVLPGEKLAPEAFSVQDVNVAQGQAKEFRGVILPIDSDLSQLEARQTVIEGQMLLSTSVQKIPHVRRGDAVRVDLISNGLVIHTQGTAEEPGYVGGQVRVLSSKTKRSLAGNLTADRVVEVKL